MFSFALPSLTSHLSTGMRSLCGQITAVRVFGGQCMCRRALSGVAHAARRFAVALDADQVGQLHALGASTTSTALPMSAAAALLWHIDAQAVCGATARDLSSARDELRQRFFGVVRLVSVSIAAAWFASACDASSSSGRAPRWRWRAGQWRASVGRRH